jgi:hypothetical protein
MALRALVVVETNSLGHVDRAFQKPTFAVSTGAGPANVVQVDVQTFGEIQERAVSVRGRGLS